MAFFAMLLGWLSTCEADPPTLRIVAPTSQSMPMLRMEQQKPVEGLLKDVGELLAQGLGLKPVFLALPSKRAASAVAVGTADLLCNVKPEWIDGNVLWTRPFLSGTGIVAAGPSAPEVSRLENLRDEPIGTVLGYRYPAIERALPDGLRREDVADAEMNLRRLAFGRIRYAVTDRVALAHYLKAHPSAGLREVIAIEHYRLGCALAPDKRDLLQPLNRLIGRMQADGTLAKLLNRYR